MFDRHSTLLKSIPKLKRESLEELCRKSLNRDKHHMSLLAQYIARYGSLEKKNATSSS